MLQVVQSKSMCPAARCCHRIVECGNSWLRNLKLAAHLAHAHAFQLNDLAAVLVVAGVAPVALHALALLGRRGVIHLRCITDVSTAVIPEALMLDMQHIWSRI